MIQRNGVDYFDSEMKITRETLRNKVPEGVCLYHYTSAAGFLGILDSKKIWASSHKKLNDPIEIRYGRNVVRNVLEEYRKKNNLNEYRKKIISQALAFGFNPNMSSPETLHFIASLTEEPDLLSQWIYYGDSGRGFALQLTFPEVEETFAYNFPASYFIVKIEYDSTKQNADCLQAIEEILEEGERNSMSDSQTLFPLLRTLESLAMSFKQNGFKEEKEWRIVSTQLGCNSFDYRKGNTKFREHKGQIIQYKEIEIAQIRSVVMGPLQELNVDETIMLLRENNFVLIPKKSKIILRDVT